MRSLKEDINAFLFNVPCAVFPGIGYLFVAEIQLGACNKGALAGYLFDTLKPKKYV